jgi:hypothetical protein
MIRCYVDKSLTLETEKELLYLIQFYDIQGYEYWGRDEDYFASSPGSDLDGLSDKTDSDSDSCLQQISIKEAVRKYPRVALDELASTLGIMFHDICDFYQRGAQFRQQSQLAAIKRGTADMAGTTRAEDIKRVRVSPKDTLDLLVRALPVKSASESSGGRLLWGSSNERKHMPELIAKMQAYKPDRTPSRESSENSPTEFISSQEMQRALGRRRGGQARD